jgi:peptidoglycan hydrolase-like protein with peptidoglycan-binding domain
VAPFRNPGPLGTSGDPVVMDDGTLIRQVSPKPGPICFSKVVQPTTGGGQVRRFGAEWPSLPYLQQGDTGGDVNKLQSFLNFRLELYPPLRVDGYFGAGTRQAVLDYQTTRALRPDGEVGKMTWYHLLVSAEPGAAGGATKPRKADSPLWSPPADSVMDWSLQTKCEYVAAEAQKQLPSQLRSQVARVMPAQYLAAILERIAECFLFDVAKLLRHGAITTSKGEGIFELMLPTKTTVLAAIKPELDQAAGLLAQALGSLGVAALAEFRLIEGGSTQKDDSSGPKPSPEAPPPRQAATPSPAREAPPPDEPVFSAALDAAAMADAMRAAAQSGAPFCEE